MNITENISFHMFAKIAVARISLFSTKIDHRWIVGAGMRRDLAALAAQARRSAFQWLRMSGKGAGRRLSTGRFRRIRRRNVLKPEAMIASK